MSDLLSMFDKHPTEAVGVAVCAVLMLATIALATRRAVRAIRRSLTARRERHAKNEPENQQGQTSGANLWYLGGAALGTGVAAQGMWAFFRDTLHMHWSLRIIFFAFIEVQVIQSALRARRSSRAGHGAGVDGVAMWVLTMLSAVLSATHSHNAGEALFRLSAPLVAAWGWERSMQLERRDEKDRKAGQQRAERTGIHWRLTPERVLVRLGLADPTERTASEVAAERRLTQMALAAHRARSSKTLDKWWGKRKHRRNVERLEKAAARAVQDGDLGTDPARRDALMGKVAVLYHARALLDLTPESPWQPAPTAEPHAPAIAAELELAPAAGRRMDRDAAAGPQETDEPAASTPGVDDLEVFETRAPKGDGQVSVDVLVPDAWTSLTTSLVDQPHPASETAAIPATVGAEAATDADSGPSQETDPANDAPALLAAGTQQQDQALTTEDQAVTAEPAALPDSPTSDPAVESEEETRRRAIELLKKQPGLSGAELGRQLGKSERQGQRLRRDLQQDAETIKQGPGGYL